MDLSALMALASAERRTEEVVVEGIRVRVREPSASVHSRYGVLWTTGRDVEAMAHLLLECVIDDSGKPPGA